MVIWLGIEIHFQNHLSPSFENIFLHFFASKVASVKFDM